MFRKLLSCFVALTLVTLVHGDRHKELLASGYVYIPDVGYYAIGTGKNWLDAQDDCMSTKGRLAIINSEEELQAIVSFFSNHTEDTYVFGGYTNKNESQYVTPEGIPLKETKYTKWETGKASGFADRCGGINTKTGELVDFPCNEAKSYVCEHQLWTDYTYVKDIGYYKLHTDGLPWADAYTVCENEGAHLLIINSQAEADAIMKIYNENPSMPNTDYDYYVFLGFRAVFQDLSSKPNEGTYLTISGISVSDLGYVNWSRNQPSGSIGICGGLYRTEASYVMLMCDEKLAFFCEKEFQEFNKT